MTDEPNLSCLTKFSNLRGVVTVEVIIVLYIFASVLLSPALNALVYRKICLERFNLTVCDNLNEEENQDFETVVQSDASHWYLVNNLCAEIPSILLSPIYGSLSDNMGRKAALILPLFGQILCTVNYVINSLFMDLPVWHILFGTLTGGIFGGWVSCGMACFAYLSEVTAEKSRTARIAIVEGASSVSAAVAFLIGGRILDSTSLRLCQLPVLGLICSCTAIHTSLDPGATIFQIEGEKL